MEASAESFVAHIILEEGRLMDYVFGRLEEIMDLMHKKDICIRFHGFPALPHAYIKGDIVAWRRLL